MGNPGSATVTSDLDDVTSTPGVPVYNNDLRIHNQYTDSSFGNSFTSMFTRSGSGRLAGFEIKFDSKNIRVRLTIDSNEIFDIDLNDLQEFGQKDDGHLQQVRSGKDDKCFVFEPKFPVYYESSILIEHRTTSGSKKRKGYFVMLSEET